MSDISGLESVYIVTHGDYSAYSIVSVHSREADAEIVAKRIGGDVEEWALDAENIDHYRHPFWWVRLTRDGIGACTNADTQASTNM